MYALTNFNLIEQSTNQYRNHAIVVKNGVIHDITKITPTIKSLPIYNLSGDFLSAGFIDLQLNGCGGVLLNNDICEQTLNQMHKTNLLHGCTSFLPTLISCSDEKIKKTIHLIKNYKKKFPARIPGLHLEGPFLNKSKKGIHNEKHIRPPSQTLINYFCDNFDTIKKITLAPEACSLSHISQLSEAGIIVSIGHSNATFEEVKQAEEAGATFVTHLFNAMSPLTSRNPGVVGATLFNSQLKAGIIADGFHVHWHNILLSQQLLNERLILVTDATAPAGTNMKSFEFEGQQVFHQNGKCTNKDGTLGGSALTMITAITNCINNGIAVEKAYAMATKNPAKAINYDKKIGFIEVGNFANFVILTKDHQIISTITPEQSPPNIYLTK